MADFNYSQWMAEWNKQYQNAPSNAAKDALMKIKQQVESQYGGYIQDKTNQRYEDITNFNSQYYKQYADYISKMNPQVSLHSLLGASAGAGFKYGTSQKLANEQSQRLNTQRTENINRGVQAFALGSQGQGNALLGQMASNNQFQQNLTEQQRQFNESQPTFLDSLLNIGGGIAGYLTGGLFGGGNSQRGLSGIDAGNYAYKGKINWNQPGGWYGGN